MALKSCRECGKEVSTEAKTCPHCGVEKPTTPQPTAKDTITGLVFLVLVVAGALTMCGESDSEKQAKAQAKAAEDAKCAQELSCIGERLGITASGFCSDQVERLAKNSATWTDKTLEPKFSHYRWANTEKSAVTLIGDKVQFQNGFGAHVNMVYHCDVDVKTKAVIGVRANPGKL